MIDISSTPVTNPFPELIRLARLVLANTTQTHLLCSAI
jgi:hypothetical protein